ncbi:MAG: transglycosylase SLT domain-containing protein [Rikenellaceae bacterium]|nr:transglycosylase SLT domain-containing protein [Rikenellaceae bacterium]
MRRLLMLLLLAALTTNTALAADGIFNRKKERKRNKRKTEQVEAVKVSPEPQKKQLAEEVILTPDTVAVKVVENDITLNLTPDQVDSLITEWRELREGVKYDEYFKNFIGSDSIRIEGTDSVANAERDTLYARRLKNLVSPIPLAYNYIVRASIDRYVKSTSGTISRILGLSQVYFPLIEDELMKAELPIELRAMPIIESALQVNAVSRAGAVGLWQFMPTTGKSYGLEVNSLVDERRDPIRSTYAAVRFLKDLYRMFGDWTLAIAAYNCGPGNVNKAIARSGGKTFWEIYDYLPRETRGYVPAFIAATYAFNYHRDHGIEMTKAPIPIALDTIHINRVMHLEQIASTIDVNMETLRLLNPQYRADIIPASTKPYTLILPQRYVNQYIEHEAEIMGKDTVYLKEYLNPANLDKKRLERREIYHRIKRGETLGGIARRYGVTVSQLMRWNGIKNASRIREGQRLRIQK